MITPSATNGGSMADAQNPMINAPKQVVEAIGEVLIEINAELGVAAIVASIS
jgi:hypothetical protein